jgi:hypothetical protein
MSITPFDALFFRDSATKSPLLPFREGGSNHTPDKDPVAVFPSRDKRCPFP